MTRAFRLVGLAGGLAWAVAAPAIERRPVEDFARKPDTLGARLSPDGRNLAFLRDVAGQTRLHVLNLEEGRMYRVNPGEAALIEGARKEVGTVEWVGNERVMITTTVGDRLYGILAMDLNGARVAAIGGMEDGLVRISGPTRLYPREIIHRFFNKEHTVLMLDRHEAGPGSANRPDVLKVDMSDGSISVELKNPGEVAGWAADGEGVVRFGVLSHGELSGAIYRADAKAPWRTILPLENRSGGMRPVGFDTANGRVLVTALTPERRWTIYPLDPATGTLGGPLLSDPEYDILPDRYLPRIDGMALCAPVFSRTKDALLGVRYVADAPRVKWFDREFAMYQAAVDRTLKDTVNILVDLSQDGRRMLWFGYSDRNPGVYLFLDLDKKILKPIALRMSWIKPEQMAPMLAVKYPARDGLVIHGFLTVPVGHELKQLPLVVMPHGGPWVRDVWGYDSLVQLLANRGYAVLQMNYRGSPGYGEDLYQRARRQIGGKIQDDIEDGTRWAVAAGIADPRRVAILGASYGGYSALFALGHNPELYRCGISMNGVTDWPEIFDDRKSDPIYKMANAHWRREIGDPNTEAEFLRAISPVNFAGKITAPVLIVQGKEDRTVPPEQARLMIKALERAGRKPQSLLVGGLGHSFGDERRRSQVFTAMVEFLEKNLGPGVP